VEPLRLRGEKNKKSIAKAQRAQRMHKEYIKWIKGSSCPTHPGIIAPDKL